MVLIAHPAKLKSAASNESPLFTGLSKSYKIRVTAT